KVLVTGTPGGRATRGPKRHRRHLLECHGKAATTSADLLGNFRLLTRVRQAIDRARQRAVARRSVGQGAGALSSRRSRPACVHPVAPARIFSLPYRSVLCASARTPESVQVDAEAMNDRSKSHATPPPHDPLAQSLSAADDRIQLNAWLPPQQGVVPRIRVGRRWINLLWLLPLAFILLVIAVAVAQALRQAPAVQEFLVRYPGIPRSAAAVTSGFPAWLRLLHFLNLLFMTFIIRAGVQILAQHPRLYRQRDCQPGTEWFRFQEAVPAGRIWTAKDDSVTVPAWLGIPGIRHSIGLARWWHFSITLLWMINGSVFYALLFWTDQWRRVVPSTWEVF